MFFPGQYEAKDAAQKSANAAGVSVYYYRHPLRRGSLKWEISLNEPVDVSNFGKCNPVKQES